jgi:hypothetical protein
MNKNKSASRAKKILGLINKTWATHPTLKLQIGFIAK